MRITIDVSPAVHHRAGMGRYAGELVRALRQVAGDEVALQVFYAEARSADPRGTIAVLPRYSSRLGYKPWRLSAMLSHFTRLPFDRLYGGPDLVHATDHLLPHLRARSIFTLHDLIFEHFPEHHRRYNYTFLKLMMPRFLAAADQIITVSEQSKRDAVQLYGIPPEKITVIYHGVDPRYRPPEDRGALEAVRSRYGLPEQYILHVGTIEPRKNLGTLLDAFGALKDEFPALKLVLAGKKGWLYEPFFAKLRQSGLASEVIFPGYVAEEDLPALFQLATVFAFPSVYEGFGLPALEALACGTPVLCSNRSSLPEVVGEAAVLVDPDEPADLAEGLRRLLTDGALHRALREAGPQQAANFSWERAARESLAVYERAYRGQR